MEGWIDVKNELPKPQTADLSLPYDNSIYSEEVFVHVFSKLYGHSTSLGYYNHNEGCWEGEDGTYQEGRVRHWMPIPNLPED